MIARIHDELAKVAPVKSVQLLKDKYNIIFEDSATEEQKREARRLLPTITEQREVTLTDDQLLKIMKHFIKEVIKNDPDLIRRAANARPDQADGR